MGTNSTHNQTHRLTIIIAIEEIKQALEKGVIEDLLPGGGPGRMSEEMILEANLRSGLFEGRVSRKNIPDQKNSWEGVEGTERKLVSLELVNEGLKPHRER